MEFFLPSAGAYMCVSTCLSRYFCNSVYRKGPDEFGNSRGSLVVARMCQINHLYFWLEVSTEIL